MEILDFRFPYSNLNLSCRTFFPCHPVSPRHTRTICFSPASNRISPRHPWYRLLCPTGMSPCQSPQVSQIQLPLHLIATSATICFFQPQEIPLCCWRTVGTTRHSHGGEVTPEKCGPSTPAEHPALLKAPAMR